MKAVVEKFSKDALAQFEESASYARESNSYPAWTLQFTVIILYVFFMKHFCYIQNRNDYKKKRSILLLYRLFIFLFVCFLCFS
jgi:Ca2+/Na+ antiporter